MLASPTVGPQATGTVLGSDKGAAYDASVTTTSTDQERLAAWEAKVSWLIVVAATLPLALAILPFDAEGPATLLIDLGSWAVFLVDLIVHVVISRKYLRTGRGLFDLSIVVFTFPWYVLPGVEGTQFLAVFRLARLLRVVTATRGGRRLRYLYDQMGGLLVVTLVTLLVASLIVLQAEPPSSGFETFGDAVWWGIVTLTTVGYGDLYPTTSAGRLAGFIVMVLGLAVLGTLAGVLASMFGGAADPEGEPTAFPDETAGEAGAIPEQLNRLGEQLAGLEEQLVALRRSIESPPDR